MTKQDRLILMQYPNRTNPAGGINTIEKCGLYNIIQDPEEHVHLATKKPDALKVMQQKLAKIQATISTLIVGKFGQVPALRTLPSTHTENHLYPDVLK